MSIYVIARDTRHEDSDGRDYFTEDIDPDYGYFTEKEAAEAFVESLDGPARASYEERLSDYRTRLAAERSKAEQAQKLGFRHDYHIYAPYVPDYHVVIEINPAKAAS